MKILAFFIFPFIFAACTSAPVIPENTTSARLIQLGQDALSASNYKKAEYYYNAVIQRYGMDTAIYIEARYELGHLYLKTKDYEKAFSVFDEILNIYANAEYGSIPQAYRKLSQMGMNKIPDKYKK